MNGIQRINIMLSIIFLVLFSVNDLAKWGTERTTSSTNLLAEAFVVGRGAPSVGWMTGRHLSQRTTKTALLAAETTELPDVATMKAGEMRKELESYGVSTKSFLEKSELSEAVKKARAEGKVPINGSSENEAFSENEHVNGKVNGSDSSSSSSSSSKESRSERLEKEMEKAKQMSVGELRKELSSRGVSTKSFFEKSEFVKAYAEAVVDGVTKRQSSSTSTGPKEEDEPYDPSYRDVTVQKMARQDQQRLLQGVVIDIPLKK